MITIIEKLRFTKRKIIKNLFWQIKYNKFVIITRSRTGSNLLINLLNQHPNIEAHGEIFRRLRGRNEESILLYYFSKKPKRIKYVGFKIFYYHPLDTTSSKIWDLIKKDKSIRIKHLQRQNLLRTHISRLIAGKTDQWISKEKSNVEINNKNKRVKINIPNLINEFEKTENYKKQTIKYYNDHPFFELTYEQLVNNQEETLNKIFDFLGIREYSLTSNLQKQNPEEIKHLVTNYQELKEGLSNTKYASFLDDQ